MTAQFDDYGEAAASARDLTELSGRYAIQASAERLVAADVAHKLNLLPDNDFLEIGCGAGNQLIPLSFRCRSATGIDHPKLIKRLNDRYQAANLKGIGSNFLTWQAEQKFDRILVYSVLHALPDRDTVFAFVDRAVGVLRDDGAMLLGDLNNIGKKQRFSKSEQGKQFAAEWEAQMAAYGGPQDVTISSGGVQFDDELVMELLMHVRKMGFHSYLLPQQKDLPFGRTREDILVQGPEYQG
ncbi:MAG: methyltransferase domain-containing protein [Nitratireductor sp.]